MKNNANKKMIRLVAALLALMMTLGAPPSASAAGTEVLTEFGQTLAAGTILKSSSVTYGVSGLNQENYIEYTPGAAVLPVVYYGSKLRGFSTINALASSLENSGRNVIAGMNGDFFFTDTGIPIGMVVTDGILRCSDSGVNAVGFLADGSAIIGKPALSMMAVTADNKSITIDYINKTRKDYGVYLMSSDFSATSATTTDGCNAVLKITGGSLKIGGTVTAEVVSVSTSSAGVALGEGTLLLTASTASGNTGRINWLTAGTKLTISVTASDPRWNEVLYAAGAGDMLVDNGAVNTTYKFTDTGPYANPRSAIGIKADGTVVMYTVDGRQKDISNGVKLTELAERMLQLGCIYAVNMDGGASSVLSAEYPGTGVLSTVNIPSSGKQREVANGIFLVNTAKPSGNTANAFIYPNGREILSGAKIPLSLKTTDENYNPSPLMGAVNYSAENGTVDANGVFTAGTEGIAKVTAYSWPAIGTAEFKVIATPQSFTVKNEKTGAAVTSADLQPGEVLALTAVCMNNGRAVLSSDDAIKWEAVGDIGTVDAYGTFTASSVKGARGILRASVGKASVEIKVAVGTADNMIETFETDIPSVSAGSASIYFSIENDKTLVRYGDRAGKIAYDFSQTAENSLRLNTQWMVAKDSGWLHMWVYGDGSGATLTLTTAAVNGTVTEIAACTLDFTGYRAVTVALPADTAKIGGITVTKGSRNTGIIYIDQVCVSKNNVIDTTAPVISVFGCDLTAVPGFFTITATISDDGAAPDPKKIILALDGTPLPLTVSGTALSAQTPNPNDGKLHRLTLTVSDAAGNLARAGLDINLSDGGSVSTLFMDAGGHWCRSYAEYLYGAGIISGTSRADGIYLYPDDMMTRAQFAVMMARYLGLDLNASASVVLPYADNAKIPSWAYPSVAALYLRGAMQGKSIYGTLYFKPDDTISRAEAVTVIGRTLTKGYETFGLRFTDADKIPSWAEEYVEVLAAIGVIGGYSDGTVRPNNTVNRSEAMKMIYGLT